MRRLTLVAILVLLPAPTGPAVLAEEDPARAAAKLAEALAIEPGSPRVLRDLLILHEDDPEVFDLWAVYVAERLADAKGKVYVTSPVGKDMVIEVDVEGHHIKVITPANYKVDMGQEVWLRCNNEKVHVFNNSNSTAYF